MLKSLAILLILAAPPSSPPIMGLNFAGKSAPVAVDDAGLLLISGTTVTPVPSTFATVQTELVCCGLSDGGASATAFPTALSGRSSVLEQNQNSATVWIGTANTVNALNGIELAGGTPGASMVENPASTVTRYCVASTAMVSDAGCLFVQETK